MLPIPGLEQIRIQWLMIEKGGYKLYGFLLYTGTDNVLVDYLKEGITDLDVMSGNECAIFLIEPPSKKWISYARSKGHQWLNLFPQEKDAGAAAQTDNGLSRDQLVNVLVSGNERSVVVVGNNNVVSLNQLLEPEYDELYDRSEALAVARHFNLSWTDIPCLIFFKDLDGDVIWNKNLGTYLTIKELTGFFRAFFGSAEFSSLLKY